MSKIDKDELFQHLSGYLKAKGVELQEGSYTRRIQQGCNLMAETVNRSQSALQAAKTEVGKRLDQVRQVIHEKTAPTPPPANVQSDPPAGEAKTASPKPKAKKPAARSTKPAKRKSRA